MIFISLGVAVVVLVIIFLSTYTVVEPNEAHIVTRLSRGRKVYSPKIGTDGKPMGKTAYFYIPFLMKRNILYLTNVKLIIPDILLHDKEVAPFLCDVVCWFHVYDPALAAERLDLTDPFESVKDSLINLIQAVGREAAMKQELLDIMRDRQTFGNGVQQAVGQEMLKWGVDVVDLEINDMRDSEGSSVIENYESIRKVQVQTTARKLNALRVREAIEVEQENKQIAEIRTAEAEEAFRKRQIEKDKAVGISEATKDQEIARKTEEANKQRVEAQRTLEVGQADIKAQAVVKVATGEAEAVKVRGEKQSEVTKLLGFADADVVEKKGLAEATAKSKMAEALKLFNEAGITLEQIRAFVEVQKAKFSALPEAFSKANINLTSSDPQKIFGGFGLDAEGGASLAQFIKTLEKTTGKSVTEIVDDVKKIATGEAK